ncbi:MAG: hypothetical protein ABSA92_10575 [Candidatus Bathyarchaeia archaeon]|jgi:hypothetical protein
MRDCTARFLAVITLIIFIELGTIVPIHATSAVAIVVYDHGLVKAVKWASNGHLIAINRTNSFTQDDPYLYAYFTAALSSANVTWQWYDPSGVLFRSRDDQLKCAVSPCSYVFYFGIQDSPAADKFGRWRLDLEAGGSTLYSDFFTITPVVNQDDHWSFNVIQSAPPLAQGQLAVTIHPSNLTWSQYQIYMPYAANLTAKEANTNHLLNVTSVFDAGNNLVTVNFGGPRPDGYSFVLSFDLRYGLQPLIDYQSGQFVLTWRERGWERLADPHPIPETFNITLPQGSTLVDTVGFNTMSPNQNVTIGNAPSISLATTFIPRQTGFGWNLIYRDYTFRSLHPISVTTPTGSGLISATEHLIPFLPLTLGSISLWTAIMSVFLLTGSELLSPIYIRTGILIDRRRLRIAALILVIIFLVTTGYRLLSVPLTH